jgi:hypothetical protein
MMPRRHWRMLLEGGDIMAKPPRHGQIKVSSLPMKHAKAHLAATTASIVEVHDYGARGMGFSSQGSFSPGGASGAIAAPASSNS